MVRSALQQVFGDHLLQIGGWGEPGIFLEGARTRFQTMVDTQPDRWVAAAMSQQRLAISSDSVDAVLLPHTLEVSQEPHAVLREVHRILRPEGHLLLLGFNPFSWLGLRHQFAARGFPPGFVQHMSQRRIGDWLRLLSLSIENVVPIRLSISLGSRVNFIRKFAWSQPAYLVVAKKDIMPMTQVRPRGARRPRLVRGLVNPTTRNTA